MENETAVLACGSALLGVAAMCAMVNTVVARGAWRRCGWQALVATASAALWFVGIVMSEREGPHPAWGSVVAVSLGVWPFLSAVLLSAVLRNAIFTQSRPRLIAASVVLVVSQLACLAVAAAECLVGPLASSSTVWPIAVGVVAIGYTVVFCVVDLMVADSRTKLTILGCEATVFVAAALYNAVADAVNAEDEVARIGAALTPPLCAAVFAASEMCHATIRAVDAHTRPMRRAQTSIENYLAPILRRAPSSAEFDAEGQMAASNAFLDYVERVHAEENLFFLQRTQERVRGDPAERAAKAAEIIRTFINAGAPLELNLSHEARRATLAGYTRDASAADLFDAARAEVLKLLRGLLAGQQGAMPNEAASGLQDHLAMQEQRSPRPAVDIRRTALPDI